ENPEPEESEEPEDVVVETENNPRFTCQTANGQYTVMYTPEEQPDQAYPWAIPQQLGGGWTPEKRCNVIAQRLEQYRPDGLVELRTGVENTYDILCVTTQDDPSCRIVLTVPPGQDPEVVRDSVFRNLTVADSGQQTQGVPTFLPGRENNTVGNVLERVGEIFDLENASSDGRIQLGSPGAINLRPFLAPSDGGTGAYLQNSNSLPSQPPASRPTSNPGGRRLNPDNFR
ncbi:MAG: hypothetical protein F6K03_14045, partial [Kamptonema sp. SIO4C4]|nr:hypothetical protein [Kamptonema sp. SIO4C4]